MTATNGFANSVEQFSQPDQETALLLMIAKGDSNRDIANHTGYSVDTIKRLTGTVAREWGAANHANIVHQACVTGRLVVGHHRVEQRLVTVEEYEHRRDQLTGSLTQKQAALLRPVADGLTNRAIARQFDVHEETVKSHLSLAMRRWKARNRANWVYIAWQHDLVLAGQAPLSEVELDVIRLVAKGKSTNDIAAHLHLPPDMVRTHLVRASRKVGAVGRDQLVTVARVRGLIGGDTDD